MSSACKWCAAGWPTFDSSGRTMHSVPEPMSQVPCEDYPMSCTTSALPARIEHGDEILVASGEIRFAVHAAGSQERRQAALAMTAELRRRFNAHDDLVALLRSAITHVSASTYRSAPALLKRIEAALSQQEPSR